LGSDSGERMRLLFFCQLLGQFISSCPGSFALDVNDDNQSSNEECVVAFGMRVEADDEVKPVGGEDSGDSGLSDGALVSVAVLARIA
jgi:hypothetical protein